MKNILIASVALLSGFLAGCGPSEPDKGPLGTLSGKVTLNGEDLVEGSIILSSEGGGSGAAVLQTDGTFLVTDRAGGIPVGTYRVAFVPATVEVDGGPNSPPRMEAMKTLPEKYYSETLSGLTVEIEQGANTQDFDLSE